MDDNFPVVVSYSTDRLHNYFRERITYFFYNLTRKTDNSSIFLLQSELSDTLTILKSYLISQSYSKEWTTYLELFFSMIGHTRDFLYGKGEHELSYMLIYVFHDTFPLLSIYALQRFVIPFDLDITSHHDFKTCYGSWRDIPYLCDYIRKNSNSEHPLIYHCVKIMNQQLIDDYNTWHFSKNARSVSHISNVAKWIPREKKKFDWLYNILVKNWSETVHPHIFKSVTNNYQYQSACCKSKRLYRKQIAFFNKLLDTTEIKLCSQNFSNIQPNKVPITHFYNHFDKYCSRNEFSKYINLSKSFNQHIYNTIIPRNHDSYYNPKHSLAFFIKQAKYYSELPSIMLVKNKKNMDTLNQLWNKHINSISNHQFEYVIPFLDISYTMQNHSSDIFYYAIAFSIIIAQKSKYSKRIIAMDHFPTWINLDYKNDLISMVTEIFSTIHSMQNTECNFNKAMELFHFGLNNSKSKNNYIQKLTLVFFSNFVQYHFNNDLYKKLTSYFKTTIPFFIFWNLSNFSNMPVLLHNYNDKIAFFSGLSINLIHHIPNIQSIKQNNSFHIVNQILSNQRYFPLINFVQQHYTNIIL